MTIHALCGHYSVWRRYLIAAGASSSILLAGGAGGESAAIRAEQQAAIRGDIAWAAQHAADEHGRVHATIVMRDQIARQALEAFAHLPKSQRRAAVIEALRNHAAQTQRSLLERLDAAAEEGGAGDELQRLWIVSAIGVRITPELALELAAREDVASLTVPRQRPGPRPGEPSRPAEPFFEDIEPNGGGGGGDGPADIECGVEIMGAPLVWGQLGITGRDIVVGVIDSGCCVEHPDLINQVWTNPGEIAGNGIDDDANGFVDDIHGWSFDSNGSSPDISDPYSHGTHVTGTVAGDGAGGTITGMAPDCRFMTLKIWNSFEGELSVWNCMQYGVDNGADVLTASLGWPHWQGPDRATWRAACENTIAAGVIVIYAAGNEGGGNEPDNVRTPGDVPDVITVGATDCGDVLPWFTSRGPVEWEFVAPYHDWPFPPGKTKPTIVAPGVDTLSTRNDCETYSMKSGTSMATPHVAGAVALMLEANPALDHAQVKQILMDTAIDLEAPGIDNDSGAGRVDAYAAVLAAIEPTVTPAELLDVGVPFGTLLAGGVTEIAESDDVTLDAGSSFGFSAQEANRLDIRIGFRSPGASLLDIVVEMRLNNPGGEATLMIYHWADGGYYPLHAFAVGLGEVIERIEDVAADGYIDPADGRIDLLLRQSVVATFSAAGFTSHVDFVGVGTH